MVPRKKFHTLTVRTPAGNEARTRVPERLPLTDALASAGVIVEQPCGGRGTCGKCRVRYLRRPPSPVSSELALLGEGELRNGWRLSCCHFVECNTQLEAPSDLSQIGLKGFGPAALSAPPSPRFRFVEVAVDSRAARAAGALEDVLPAALISVSEREAFAFTVESYRQLAEVTKDEKATVSCWLFDRNPIHVGSVATPKKYALVGDLGTTTLAAALLELPTGEVVSEIAELNPQIRCGADVMSRIAWALSHGHGELHRDLRAALEKITDHLCRRAKVDVVDIIAAAFCGNSFMMHCLLNVAPFSLGKAPYVPVWRRPLQISGAVMGLAKLAHATVVLLPMLASHVGADAAAAILATDLDVRSRPGLLLDLGTNCEIILATPQRIYITSAAAGPAFEGGNISCGMRATRGAIDRVAMTPDGQLWVHTVGNASPRGLCGAGLIDLVALLLEAGIIDPSGRFISPELTDQIDKKNSLLYRIRRTPEGMTYFEVASSARGPAIALTAQDVRQLQLVKGSIRAAIDILLEEARISPADLDGVFLAGQLGSYLKKSSVIRLGILPDVKPGRIHFVGNAAGYGCRLALVDANARQRLMAMLDRVCHVELAGHPRYEAKFIEALWFHRSATQHA